MTSPTPAGALAALAVRPAVAADAPAIHALLDAATLPHADVAVGKQEFLLAFDGGSLVACVGLESVADAGLLRSFAVVPERRNAGLGSALFERIVAHARARGVGTVYALTTTAERFCLAHGFERVDRAAVPPRLAALPEFRSLCPATAVCLRRSV
jgi:amino-acid N-acetyltransferase